MPNDEMLPRRLPSGFAGCLLAHAGGFRCRRNNAVCCKLDAPKWNARYLSLYCAGWRLFLHSLRLVRAKSGFADELWVPSSWMLAEYCQHPARERSRSCCTWLSHLLPFCRARDERPRGFPPGWTVNGVKTGRWLHL
ncbi:hypothetical protein BU25DRAFT_221548 [Macroventuria anomochaeta]|uniref:Uncharacterized protein n=1 Tax=Macroventuria anomochaeta TaxID=301207 RepID=A0ACB6SCA2_9PLEO|nr:uncharacterized protein BU25DRAFT_221548 [Macroventuria anomochaeta]KAF2630968.1 hypothetical protein BU25DRAFT_221548 [Macroventuria anomochaeta]